MIARERRGLGLSAFFVRLSGFHKRPNADVDAEDVRARRLAAEIKTCGFEDKFNLLLEGLGLVAWAIDGRVRCTHNGVSVPWNGEHHTAIAGVRHHDGSFAAQEAAFKDEMDALAGSDHRLHLRFRHAAHFVCEDACGVDDGLRRDGDLLSALAIFDNYTLNETVFAKIE